MNTWPPTNLYDEDERRPKTFSWLYSVLIILALGLDAPSEWTFDVADLPSEVTGQRRRISPLHHCE
jgi:hypothetical protein